MFNHCMIYDDIIDGVSSDFAWHCYKMLAGPPTPPRPRPTPRSLYINAGRGKCVIADGPVMPGRPQRTPRHRKLHGVGHHGCKHACDRSASCQGYSVHHNGNCLLWLESGLTGGGQNWGGAHCRVKPGLGMLEAENSDERESEEQASEEAGPE